MRLEGGFITSGGYRAAKARVRSARALTDDLLIPEIQQIHAEDYGVYGVRKMWHALRRNGWDIGRDQTAPLMRAAGVEGAVRGRKPRTIVAAPVPDHRPDLVERNFKAPPRAGCGSLTSPMCALLRSSSTPPSSLMPTAAGPLGGQPARR